MKAPVRSILLVVPLLVASCNGSGSGQKIVTNAMPLEVSDPFGTSSSGKMPNMLYTTLTIRDTNSNCQTIDHIQVDTGSTGLRIFKQALTVGLMQILSGPAPLGVCENFASGNAWGPVQTASVKLASEPAITIPVQVIDATFGMQPAPSPCDSGAWSSPMDIHANGILGIDVGGQDFGVYFTCQANACTEVTPSTSQRVANPVLKLPADNNGVIINLPGVPDNGQATAYGDLILGIGTTWNNEPETYSAGNPVVTVKLNASDPLSASGVFGSSVADQVSFSAFALDSGSNTYYFNDPFIPVCPSLLNLLGLGGWYCPGNPKNFAVRVTGTGGTVWNFQVWIRDETTLAATGNLAFNDLGHTWMSGWFIAGLPFFYGKQVYLGYATRSSTLGDGPLYGYALK